MKLWYNIDNEREGYAVKVDKRIFKKEGEELQQYLHFRKRGGNVKPKKGKGSFDRKKFKKGED